MNVQMGPLNLRARPLQRRSLILALMLVLVLAALSIARSWVVPVNAPVPAIRPDSIVLPLSFILNAGQTDPTVHFQVHDRGGTIFFTSDETVLALPATAQTSSPSIVRLQFQGANSDLAVVGVDPLPGIVNYFIGDNPAAWRTDIPTYARIVYRQLYPGIDLCYDGTHGQLKSAYTVAPGANPALIRWRHKGATHVQVDGATGDLLVTLSGSTLVERAPVAWQEHSGQRVSVAVRYVLAADGSVGFELGAYDPALPLTIDPTLVYSTYLGGSSIEDAEGIARDGSGNLYVTGTTNSSDFPTANAFDDTYDHEGDVYVVKISAAGNALLYSTYLGGSLDDEGNGIAVDADGHAYVTGVTASARFPTQNPLYTHIGLGDAFVVKLGVAGNSLVYSTYLGGRLPDQAEGIAVDADGNAYVTGMTFSSDFPTHSAFQTTYEGWGDAYVTVLNADGSALIYSTYLGGREMDAGASIAVDGTGNAYVAGETASTDFPTQNPAQPTHAGGIDVFVAKLSGSGDALLYSTYLGGRDRDYSYGIAVDSAGSAHVTGNTESDDFPTHNALQNTSGGGSDAFVAKLNADGGTLLYSTYLGGDGDDKGYGIAIDSADDAYVTGDTYSADFPTYGSLLGYGGNADAFVTKLEGDGSATLYSTYLGGSSGDYGTAIAVDNAGQAYVAGITFSGDFPTEAPLYDTYSGTGDVFVAQISDAPLPTPGAPTPTPISTPTRRSNLIGSYKSASQYKVSSGETLTYTIHLRNSGNISATAAVTDHLPTEMNFVVGSDAPPAVYDAGAGTLSWSSVDVAAGRTELLTFQVTATATSRYAVVFNRATIASGDDSFERWVPVLLVSGPPDGDVVPPVVHSLTIDDRDVLTSPTVTLHISATDDVSVDQMYLREWELATTPFPHWKVARSSGWIPYQADYPWTLESESGTHFVGVWVADDADNVSHLTRKALDYASLVLPAETVARHGMVPYMVHYAASVGVSATLTPATGDPDLYVWDTRHPSRPIAKSTRPGTSVDSVSFTTTEEGTYLFLVYGYTAATYDLRIVPGGGPLAWPMGEMQASGQAPGIASLKRDELVFEPLLSQSGPDPLAQAQAPDGPFRLYLPLAVR